MQLHEDSVARLSGLRDARVHDLITFHATGGHAVVFSLEQ
jgi:hypothetical protein